MQLYNFLNSINLIYFHLIFPFIIISVLKGCDYYSLISNVLNLSFMYERTFDNYFLHVDVVR